MEGGIIISSKDKIKKASLSLFVRRGYYGTSMRDIAEAVGITKATLYSHYSGKDELFLDVFEDVAQSHGKLFKQLLQASKSTEISDLLRYNFEEYILYFYRNPEIYSFSNQSLFHIPSELRERIHPIYVNLEKPYRKRLEEIFIEGMEQGIIRKGNPEKRVWSFKAKRDGVLGWMCAVPELKEDCIEEFWNDFWFGVTERNGQR